MNEEQIETQCSKLHTQLKTCVVVSTTEYFHSIAKNLQALQNIFVTLLETRLFGFREAKMTQLCSQLTLDDPESLLSTTPNFLRPSSWRFTYLTHTYQIYMVFSIQWRLQ